MVVGEPQRQTSSQLGPIEKGPQKFKTSFRMRDATDSKFGIDLALKILRSAKFEWDWSGRSCAGGQSQVLGLFRSYIA